MAESRQEPPTERTSRRRTRKVKVAGDEADAAAAHGIPTAEVGVEVVGEVVGAEAEAAPAHEPEQSAGTEQAPPSAPVDPRSLVFDPVWYLSQYADVANARADPAQHFLENGGFEGRDPNPYFSTRFYCERNPDVVESGMNPFLHYVMHGAREGRPPRERN